MANEGKGLNMAINQSRAEGELMEKRRESQASGPGVERCVGRQEARQVKLAARKFVCTS